MTRLDLVSPLAGWCLPLVHVPDPVFAGAMAGDGVAIDPTGNVLHAPCAGELVAMRGAKHAVTLRTDAGAEILMHVGIDTVKLNGDGFEPLAAPGERVRAGQPLLRFDLDLVARRSPSVVTPVVIASEGCVIVRRSGERAVAVGDFLFQFTVPAAAPVRAGEESPTLVRRFDIAFEHGIHARPAATIVAALRPFDAQVSVVARGRSGNARSSVTLMALGIHCGDTVEVRARGRDAAAALAALEHLLAPVAPRPAAVHLPPAAADKRHHEAVVACRGIALGPAVQWSPAEIAVAEAGAGVAEEVANLRGAIAAVRSRLEASVERAQGEERAILAAHVELVQDPELEREALDRVHEGKSAGFAWREATRTMIEALEALGDERLAGRAADLRDLENQILGTLAGETPGARREWPAGAIVIAGELLPSQLAALDGTAVGGICMARGGPTGHAAIIAAAKGIPTLVGAGDAVLAIAEGTAVVLDAERGVLEVSPAEARRAAIGQAIAARATRNAADLAAAHEPCVTADGVTVQVHANLGSVGEAAPALALGAQGCGLLRTEFLFLERREPPDEDEQRREYQRFAEALAGLPLTIRTLDIGGDKPIAYLPLPREDNPALGLRGLRTSLWRPELLRTQLRAILGIRPLDHCRILLPMVTDRDDVRRVRVLLREIAGELGLATLPALGAMIETPASALLAESLAAEADFLSIGTNDLSQYALAMDRGHPELGARLDGLHPAVLRLVSFAAQAGRKAGKEVAVCGSLAADPAAIAILVGLGIRELSATPAAIPRIKRGVRLLGIGACERLAQAALGRATAAEVRELVGNAVEDRGGEASGG